MSDYGTISADMRESQRREEWKRDHGMTKGAPKKVWAQEILTHLLSDDTGFTKEELSDEFGVSKATIEKRLRELRERGVKLVYGSFGIRVIGEVADSETAELINDNIKWFINTAYAMASTSQNLRPLIPQMRKYLPNTHEERAAVKKLFMRMTRLIDYMEFEDFES